MKHEVLLQKMMDRFHPHDVHAKHILIENGKVKITGEVMPVEPKKLGIAIERDNYPNDNWFIEAQLEYNLTKKDYEQALQSWKDNAVEVVEGSAFIILCPTKDHQHIDGGEYLQNK